jgi:hypothetical protein
VEKHSRQCDVRLKESSDRSNGYTLFKLYLYIKLESASGLKATVLPSGYTIRFEGRERAVAFDDDLWAEMSTILPEARAKIESIMRAYCELGPENLPPNRFKFQIQHSKDGKKTRIEEFKARHVRFYGACGRLGGRPVFLVTASDLAKKNDAANSRILKAAGNRAHELFHGKKPGK